jgi:hypothetical protein
VVWYDNRSGSPQQPNDIYGARVSGAGSVLEPAGLAISTATNNQLSPAVAWNGTNFLVVWHDSRSGSAYNIFGTRVSGAGSVLDPVGIAISAGPGANAAVAGNGTDFLVVWTDSNVYGARVSGAGTVLDPAGIPIATTASNEILPGVAASGTDFLVVWQQGTSDIYGSRVSGAGSVLDPAGIPISAAANNQQAPAVASDGTNYLVVWQDDRPSGSGKEIYAARVSGAGSVLDPAGIIVSTAANKQHAPVVAWNGSDYLVVWRDLRPGSAGIYGARVSGDGSMLDPGGILIFATIDNQSPPAVAWNGTDFLVVWADNRVWGVRVSPAGTVLDPTRFPISTGANKEFAPAVASNGTDFFVVWEDQRSGVGFFKSDIYGSRVSGAGVVLDPAGIPISTSTTNGDVEPAVAWNGTNFLVVWRLGATFGNIVGARVSSAGSVLDPADITISDAANLQSEPAVASWGDNFLVVWADRRSGTNYDIYGTGVGANGTVAQPSGIPISTAAGDQTAPDLAVRYHFLVAWRDRRSGTGYDIYGARLAPNGVVEEPAGFVVSAAAFDEGAPMVTGGPGTNWGVAYERFAAESPYGANRVFLRSVSPK